MGLFGQMKDLYKLQQEARKMQKELKKMSIIGQSKNGLVKVQINGLGEILDIYIDDSLMQNSDKQGIITGVMEAHKDATTQLQKAMQSQIDVDQLRNMMQM